MSAAAPNTAAPAIAIHGGAGIWAGTGDAAHFTALHAGLAAALAAGAAVLSAGGPALDAAIACVRVLEDHPSFNAGRGASLTRAGHAELDAAVHDGYTGRAGAVGGLRRTRSPVLAARMVMERSGHVLMTGPEAERWLHEQGLEAVNPDYFITPHMVERWEKVLAGQARGPGGTVGAVVRDGQGHLAAATSTGGLTGKLPGRLGDSPVIGAGTWADHHAAVSATGEGEAYIRAVFGFRLASLIAAGHSPSEAALQAMRFAQSQGGDGGCIVMPAHGDPLTPHLTPDMARGIWMAGHRRTAVLGNENWQMA
jgi:beta-aspartyl-peptidase (threonine type)